MEEQELISRTSIGRTNIVRITEKGRKYIIGAGLSTVEEAKLLVKRLLTQPHKSGNLMYDGITFQFEIPNDKKKLIKIVEGVLVPQDPVFLNHLLSLVRRHRNKKGFFEPFTLYRYGELFEILRDLIDAKGAILTTMRYAASHINDVKILLIVLGSHPDNWPEALVEIIDILGEITDHKFVINAHKALQKILRNKPENLEIIFTQRKRTLELISKIRAFIQH